jgi:hypothetical protein
MHGLHGYGTDVRYGRWGALPAARLHALACSSIGSSKRRLVLHSTRRYIGRLLGASDDDDGGVFLRGRLASLTNLSCMQTAE